MYRSFLLIYFYFFYSICSIIAMFYLIFSSMSQSLSLSVCMLIAQNKKVKINGSFQRFNFVINLLYMIWYVCGRGMQCECVRERNKRKNKQNNYIINFKNKLIIKIKKKDNLIELIRTKPKWVWMQCVVCSSNLFLFAFFFLSEIKIYIYITRSFLYLLLFGYKIRNGFFLKMLIHMLLFIFI